jgi:glutathione S-transferase
VEIGSLHLYHAWRSTCSRKVRICLGEKGLPFTHTPLDLRRFEHHTPEYLALNPNGYVPTLVHDGRALIESTMIDEYLDDAFPEVPLRPADPWLRHRMRVWCKFVDDVCLPAVVVPTWSQALAPAVTDASDAELAQILERVPLPERRARWAKIARAGYSEEEFRHAYEQMRLAVDRMEAMLADGDWLVGGAFTLADVSTVPYAWRFREIDPVLVDAAGHPRVAAWLERMLARPAVRAVLAGSP